MKKCVDVRQLRVAARKVEESEDQSSVTRLQPFGVRLACIIGDHSPMLACLSSVTCDCLQVASIIILVPLSTTPLRLLPDHLQHTLQA